MSILDNEPTRVRPADDYADIAKSFAYNTFHRLERTYKDGIYIVWQNPDYTPAQMIDALGTDALEVFTLSHNLRVFLNTIKPGTTDQYDTLVQPTSANPDGSMFIL